MAGFQAWRGAFVDAALFFLIAGMLIVDLPDLK
jgi:hypothetical protein